MRFVFFFKGNFAFATISIGLIRLTFSHVLCVEKNLSIILCHTTYVLWHSDFVYFVCFIHTYNINRRYATVRSVHVAVATAVIVVLVLSFIHIPVHRLTHTCRRLASVRSIFFAWQNFSWHCVCMSVCVRVCRRSYYESSKIARKFILLKRNACETETDRYINCHKTRIHDGLLKRT